MISDLKIAYSIELETWFSSIVFCVSKQFTYNIGYQHVY